VQNSCLRRSTLQDQTGIRAGKYKSGYYIIFSADANITVGNVVDQNVTVAMYANGIVRAVQEGVAPHAIFVADDIQCRCFSAGGLPLVVLCGIIVVVPKNARCIKNAVCNGALRGVIEENCCSYGIL